MPDVLEMPYQPRIIGASKSPKFPLKYRITGLTCLAGDTMGDYYFNEPLKVGSKIVFDDMLHYTMVKNTLFNGVGLPAIATYKKGSGFTVIREFGYNSFKSRLS